MICNKPVWAVICGALRQEFELLVTLSWLCEQRSKNLIDGIVLSTWTNEIDKIYNLRNKLHYLNINIVETPPIEEETAKYMNLNYTRQATQLYNGLDCVPNDVFILKCRTDFCLNYLKSAEKLLIDTSMFVIGDFGAMKFNMNYRMAVFQFSFSAPFCFQDICFIGYKNDIKKMVFFENTKAKYNDFFAPDCLFFLNMFRNDYPIIDDFFKLIKYWIWNKMVLNTINTDKKLMIPGFLLEFYSLYFVILHCCFLLIDDKASSSCEEFDIADILFDNGNKNIFKSWITSTNNSDIIKNILSGNIVNTESNLLFYKEILHISSTEYRYDNYDLKNNYNELTEFGRKMYNYEPHLWLYSLPSFGVNNLSYGLDGKNAYQILFSSYNLNNTAKSVISDIVIKKDIDVYKYVAEKYDDLYNSDINLAEIAVLSSTRSLDTKILKIVAQQLYNNMIKKTNIDSAEYVFKRYGASKSFYRFPMASDKLVALYYYGKYAERAHNDYFVTQNLYSNFCDIFKYKSDKEKNITMDDIMNLMIDTVEKEIVVGCNEILLNMSKSICEIYDDCPFSDEVCVYLKNNMKL